MEASLSSIFSVQMIMRSSEPIMVYSTHSETSKYDPKSILATDVPLCQSCYGSSEDPSARCIQLKSCTIPVHWSFIKETKPWSRGGDY